VQANSSPSAFAALRWAPELAYSGDLDRLFRLKVTRHSAGSAL
jgi:hypothetical protein